MGAYQVCGTVNLLTFIAFLVDFLGSMRRGMRIPNPILFILTLAGAFGAYVGMLALGHKLDRPGFKFTVPCLVIIHAFVLLVLSL